MSNGLRMRGTHVVAPDLPGTRKTPLLSGASYEVPAGVSNDERFSEVVCRGLVGATQIPISRWTVSAVSIDDCSPAA